MKNALSYYYNFNQIDIHQKDGIYKFKYNNEEYILYPTTQNEQEIENSYRLSLMMFNRGIFAHQIIPNINKQLFTNINNMQYVLFKIYIDSTTKINIYDIINFTNNSKIMEDNINYKRNNWYNLWINKLDYFEYQVSQFGKKYPIIRESFSYYLGLAETGISLLSNINIAESDSYICHRRINKDTTLFDFYNPLNFIIDCKSRDIAEYFKTKILEDENNLEEIKLYIMNNNLKENEIYMFYIRLFYCSFYFDLYEKIIETGEEEQKLENIIKKNQQYEIFLKDLTIFLNNIIQIPEIEWLKKI